MKTTEIPLGTGVGRRLLAAVLVLGAGRAWAATDPLIDSTRMAAARRAAAADKRAIELAEQANRDKERLGLGEADALAPMHASTDELGWTHARLQQLTHGLRVVGAGALSHRDAEGVFQPYTPFLVRGITAPEKPEISADDAVKVIERDERHAAPFVEPPGVELVYLPTWQRVLARTGEPVPPPKWNQFSEWPIPEDLQTSDVARVVSRVSLAYEVIGAEGDLKTRSYVSRAWYVDALTGEVLKMKELDESATGTGVRRWDPTQTAVSFNTKSMGCGFRMEDTVRKFATEDEDRSASDPVNCDANNVWGDGGQFQGDASASNTNRQTAMVDAHFGATVYWDLLSNVFNMQGPDDSFYSVNGFVHDGTDWANAQYHSLSGNVSFGDGPPPYNSERTRIDCLGHELGHAFNDHQVHYDGDSDCLNESLGDVFGEWTDAYLKSGFATHATVVGDIADANWTNNCSGRNMINPGASSKPALWYSGIEDIEEHDGSRPASRAFTFLARGASAFLKSSAYSPKLPWGMRGVGLQDAARIYFNGVKSFTDPDAGYAGQRSALRQAAALLFGVNTSQHIAVANAYAGINVGGLSAGYPAAPTASSEAEPNDSMTHPQTVVFNLPIPSGVVVTAPRKRKFHAAAGSSDDWYQVQVPEGKSFAARVSQDLFTSVATVELVDIYQTYASQTAGTSAATVSVTSLCFGAPSCTYWVHVHPIVVTGGYTIDLDLEQ